MEGLSDYMRGEWVPIDLMQVRDAAVSDNVPRMSALEGYGGGGPSRLIYNLGHAVFEFIEDRFGKEGLRGFLFALRKSVIGGSSGAYDEAFAMNAEEFDIAFDRWLKDRFKPFRDKERPADYGRDVSPNLERGPFIEALVHSRPPLLATCLRSSRSTPRTGTGRRRHLREGRHGHPQPDAGLQPGARVQPHRADVRGPLRDAVAFLVTQGRLRCLLRAHEQGTGAHHPGRANTEHRFAVSDAYRG